MKRLRIAILDILATAPEHTLLARAMTANTAGIMPQALAVWCEEAGHKVQLVYYTGFEDLIAELSFDIDLIFIAAFTRAAQIAYALSNLFRKRGVVTALGGPHARCFPDDARRYFDYVLGFTDKALFEEVLRDCSPHRPLGAYLTATRHPQHLPGVRERWRFVKAILTKSPTFFRIVPMIGSLGCPFSCSFCIDASVPYQPLSYDQIREDLRFLVKKRPGIFVGWHDPNFAVRFDDFMTIIEEAIPPGSIKFIAESNLSVLSEPNLKRMRKAGFKAILPGVESWYRFGNKSNTGRKQGIDKVTQVSEHINMILQYIPYVQSNFVLGLDDHEGGEPFELTKRFVDKTPGTMPGYTILTSFGEATPMNLELQRAGRVLPLPFHFLDMIYSTNVKPKNYSWPEFYDHIIELLKHSFDWKAVVRRYNATRSSFTRLVNILRAILSERLDRLEYCRVLRKLLDKDLLFRQFFEGETDKVPRFYLNRLKRDLGPLWKFLPPGALQYDQNAYLKKTEHEQS